MINTKQAKEQEPANTTKPPEQQQQKNNNKAKPLGRERNWETTRKSTAHRKPH